MGLHEVLRHQKVPGPVPTKKSIANAGGKDNHHKSLYQWCQSLKITGVVTRSVNKAFTCGEGEELLTRGLSASKGGGEACCKTGRRRRGALENVDTGCKLLSTFYSRDQDHF